MCSVEMTCSKCSNRWESRARSSRTQCGRCRAKVYVPVEKRRQAEEESSDLLSAVHAAQPRISSPHPMEPHTSADGRDEDVDPSVGVVLIFVGLAVAATLVWLWWDASGREWWERRNASPP